MEIQRYTVQACCGSKSLIFKTSRPIAKSDIDGLVKFGFVEAKQFTQSGILYVDNLDLIVSGPIGSDRLQVKCKVGDCSDKVNDFEVLLKQLG